jgi:hypothetical protein
MRTGLIGAVATITEQVFGRAEPRLSAS